MGVKTKSCLVTISDSDFSIASEVLLYSFLKYNPEFDGEIRVITDDASPEFRQRLERICPIRFTEPDPRLRAAVDKLQKHDPRLSGIHRRLFSLELFRLAEYNRVVYLDSDIYCSGDISELFSRPEPILACPDGFTLADQIRNRADKSPPPIPTIRYGKPFDRSFNAGVLSVGKPVIGEGTYVRLLDLLDPQRWEEMGRSKFTDQMVLNIHFDGQFTPLHSRYNYVIFLEEYQKCVEQVSLLDARLVHFAGNIKPWNLYDPVQLARQAPQYVKFIDVWRELLDEARPAPDDTSRLADVERRFRRQQDWIRAYNEKNIEPVGRMY